MSDDLTRKLSSETVISLNDLVAAVLEHIWIVAATSMLGVFAGFYVIAKTPQTFQASSLIEVVPPKVIANVQSTEPIANTSDIAITTMLTLFNNKEFTSRVVEKKNLSKDPNFWMVPPETIMTNYTADQAAATLGGLITTAQRFGTYLIDIKVQHESPEMCVELADAVAEEFVLYEVHLNEQSTSTSEKMVKKEVDDLHDEVLKAQRKLQDFREQYQTVVLDKDELAGTNAKVAEASRARVSLESDLKQIEASPNDPTALLGLQSIAAYPTVAELNNGIAQLQQKIATMQQRYTELHPKLIRARQELALTKEALNRAAIDAKDTVHPRYEAALHQEQSLQDQALKLNKIAIEYQNLVSDLQASQGQYDLILKRRDEIMMDKADRTQQIEVKQMAITPSYPISPNKKKIWTTCIGSGISGGLLIAFIFYFLDSSVKRVEKAEALFRLPVLTVVPESHKKRLMDTASSHPDDIEPTVKESFRSLIVALNLLGGPPGCKVCLFTSSVPDEGKSFCSYHSASHLAGQGKKTLLLDMDLRRPSLHRLIQQPADEKGATDLLSGQATFFDVVHPTAIENLFYLPSGSRSPNPIKLLSDGNFRTILDIAIPNYDYIVLDTAPINAVADTLLLVEFAHHICLIIRTGKTTVHAVRRSMQNLGNARKEPSGIIMNRFIARRGAYYYYSYSYNKSYGPDEVYGRDDSKEKKGRK